WPTRTAATATTRSGRWPRCGRPRTRWWWIPPAGASRRSWAKSSIWFASALQCATKGIRSAHGGARMEVTIARTAGFCWGVRRTVNKVLETIDEGRPRVATLGPVIHNPQTIQKFESRGVRVFDRVEDVPDGTTLVIRTHGAVIPQQNLAKER